MLFLALNEYQGRSRLWLTGGLIGLAMASRAPAGINILFFVLAILLGAGAARQRIVGLFQLLLPFAGVVALLAIYNWARFGDPLESGYTYQVNGFDQPYAAWNLPGNHAGPAFSLSYIPEHLRLFLVGLPTVNAVGTSVLLVSPYLLYVMSVPKWDLTNRLIGLNVGAVLMAVLAFRSSGFEQMGYRFSLDFLPLVFWLLMRSRVPMSGNFKGLILISTMIDLCLAVFFLATGVDRRHG
jgi:4-amino-4-deoxy-L-arabinose transferase-like glycosyltransferase